MNRRVEGDKYAAFLKKDLDRGVQFYIGAELKQRMDSRYKSVDDFIFLPVRTARLIPQITVRREGVDENGANRRNATGQESQSRN